MEIAKAAASELTILGHIQKTESYFDLKREIDSMIEEGIREIHIKIPDSVTITSSVIGLLLRASSEEGVKVNLHVGQEQLYSLLESLNMLKIFNAQKM